jgi:hypothetical protein
MENTEILEETKKEKDPSEYTPDEVELLINEVKSYRHLAGQTSARPIRLPDELTISEYNWLIGYCTRQRVAILNSNPKIPKVIPEKDGSVKISKGK